MDKNPEGGTNAEDIAIPCAACHSGARKNKYKHVKTRLPEIRKLQDAERIRFSDQAG